MSEELRIENRKHDWFLQMKVGIEREGEVETITTTADLCEEGLTFDAARKMLNEFVDRWQASAMDGSTVTVSFEISLESGAKN